MTVILDCSPFVAGFMDAYVAPNVNLDVLNVGKSFSVNKAEFSFERLDSIARHASVNGKCFVVVDHKTVLEIARLADFTDRKHFYSRTFGSPEMSSGLAPDTCVSKMRSVIADYLLLTDNSKLHVYGSSIEYQAEGLISKTYLWRKLGNVACFRHAPHGAKDAMLSAIQTLVSSGELAYVNSAMYNTTTVLYKIDLIKEPVSEQIADVVDTVDVTNDKDV